MKPAAECIARLDLLRGTTLIVLSLVLLMAAGASPVWAHPGGWTGSIAGVYTVAEYTHNDEDPWKGWLNLTVTNTGSEAWGDFHFQVIEVSGSGSVENVDWVVDTPNQPTSSQGGLSWVADNDVIGATLDLYFYGDPVSPGEMATFSVYTDNTTDKLDFFGVSFYPTPVPVPGAALLLGSGLLGLVGWRGRSRS